MAVAALGLAIAFPIIDASAQDIAGDDASAYPRLGGNVIFRLAYDGYYQADSPRLETNDLFGEMVASPRVDLTDRFSVFTEIRLEGIAPPLEDRFFEDQGIFVRSLYGTVQLTDALLLRAGKFTPSFAFASFATPGMYGNNYNKEIELIERVGLEAEYTQDLGQFGQHTLTGSAFFDDTTFLSDSLINSRGQKSVDDGGASNTETLESFTLSWVGEEFPALPGFSYKLGFIHEAAGSGDEDDENGFALFAQQLFDLGEDSSLVVNAELAPVWNFEGSADDTIFASAGTSFQTGPWLFVLSGTYRLRDRAGDSNFHDYSVQTAAKHSFPNGFGLEVAHEFNRDENVTAQRFGVRVIKQFDLD
ncbi:MAG: hypothetical protein AAGH60_11755 [Pseudomonadota bacterium]